MTLVILPLTEEQAQACAAAAHAFGVETWEMAVHLLAQRQAQAWVRRPHAQTDDRSEG